MEEALLSPTAAASIKAVDAEQRKRSGSACESKLRGDAAAWSAGPFKQGGDETKQDLSLSRAVETSVERVDWRTAAWFKGCGSDLSASHWLVSRCFIWIDLETITSEATVRHAVALKGLLDRLKIELVPRDELSDPSSETKANWTTPQVLSAVVATLFPGKNVGEETPRSRGLALPTLEIEVVDAVTDLLLSRANRDEVDFLEQWKTHLTQFEESRGLKTPSTSEKAAADVVGSKEAVGGQNEAHSVVREKVPLPPHVAKAVSSAKALTAAAIRVYSTHESTNPVEMEQLTTEITHLYKTTQVTVSGEETRRQVVAQLQHAFHREPRIFVDWSQCQLLQFGSSVSKFGTNKADLDVCLRINPYYGTVSEVMAVEFRLRNLGLPHGHTLKVAKSSQQFNATETRTTNPAYQMRLRSITAHWQALVAASQHHGKKCPAPDGMPAPSPIQSDATTADKYSFEELMRYREQRIYCIHAAADVLARNGCYIHRVVDSARIPVIQFTHLGSRLNCDLAFESYDGYLNSQLLRGYAEFDDRARALGIAIKHWVKQRKLNNTSASQLSPYSFILLMIYFLQTKAKILPNLQNRELCRKANVAPITLNGANVSFCTNLDIARSFHLAQHPTPSTKTTGDLMVSFFQFYANEFDFSELVVSVRCPERLQSKRARWGSRSERKPWCMSIEDPLDVTRDVGSVLNWSNHKRTIEEMKRALALLQDGYSFETAVCKAY